MNQPKIASEKQIRKMYLIFFASLVITFLFKLKFQSKKDRGKKEQNKFIATIDDKAVIITSPIGNGVETANRSDFSN